MDKQQRLSVLSTALTVRFCAPLLLLRPCGCSLLLLGAPNPSALPEDCGPRLPLVRLVPAPLPRPRLAIAAATVS